jgi:N-acetylneuraminic acid mutarotase
MKGLLVLFIAGVTTTLSAQTVPDLPIAIGAGTVEVWNDSLYFFGGSNTWGGRSQLYPRVYKFDGAAWTHHDSIPDNNVWDVESVLVGNEVYLLGGWRSGAALLRKYNLVDRTWTSLTPSPNRVTWGITAEYLNGFIYLINNNGSVFEYDIAGDAWATKTSIAKPGRLAMVSVVWNDEIYVVGFFDNDFYKYAPGSDTWTQLADTPYPVGACAMGVINGRIYCVAGSEEGNNANAYRTILAYDVDNDSWAVDQQQISSKRTWMAAAEYQGEFYIVGGFDSTGAAVRVIEEIIPLGPSTHVTEAEPIPAAFSLSQNYPNPFNPSTTISFVLPRASRVSLKVYNLLGKEAVTLANGVFAAGKHQVQWHAGDAASGVYFYRLKAGAYSATKRLILVK